MSLPSPYHMPRLISPCFSGRGRQRGPGGLTALLHLPILLCKAELHQDLPGAPGEEPLPRQACSEMESKRRCSVAVVMIS